MDNNALSQILPLLLQRYQSADNSQKSFADMLKERRTFVQGAENGVIDQSQGAIQNGSNGVPVSPAALDTPALGYHTDNANKTAALTQQMFGYGQQANDVLKSLADTISQAQGRGLQQQGLDLQRQELGLKYGVDVGGDTSGSTSPTSVLDLHAKNIMNGTEKLDDVPAELKPRVADKLTKLGYDPAKPINSLVDKLETTYNGKATGGTGNPLATGNDPLKHLVELLGQGASKVGYNTNYNKQDSTYNSLKDAFQSELNRLSGSDTRFNAAVIKQLQTSLPTESDPADVAAQKFQNLRDQINNVFYQGGNPPSKGASSQKGGSRYTIVEVK